MNKKLLYLLLLNINNESKKSLIIKATIRTAVVASLIYCLIKKNTKKEFPFGKKKDYAPIVPTTEQYDLYMKSKLKNFDELMNFYKMGVFNIELNTLSDNKKNISIDRITLKSLGDMEIKFLKELSTYTKDINLIFIENIQDKQILEKLKILKEFNKINTIILVFNENNKNIDLFKLTEHQLEIINNLNFLPNIEIIIHIKYENPKEYYILGSSHKLYPQSDECKNLSIYKQILASTNKQIKAIRIDNNHFSLTK